ncbi:MAG: phosphoglucosamine mutase [Ruminococcaceae bacterium]|nr:phosphoglucosamine mutase [Oscillospiraceae bacterium]
MTIGEKIQNLRTNINLSQEQLAEKLEVSRQSVSKWEMDITLPQLDKILMLCELFGISVDTLLKKEISIKSKIQSEGLKYFGTDGFRGEANINLTSMQAYKVGRFLGWYFASSLSGCKEAAYKPKIVIGKDTRRSSYMLEYSIVAGITASGADAYMLHVTTTPSVSFVTRQDEFDCGIMITASHNPFYDNGIKVINRFGEKLDDDTTRLIEAYIDDDFAALGIESNDLPLATKDKVGQIIDYVSGRNRYVGYLISLASNSYKKLNIGLDCANGASWMIADSVFSALGAKTTVIGNEPDGLNVNKDCGSTHLEKISALVKEKHLDFAFAFDGDADRCIAIDENGNIIDGDAIMYILAKRLKARNMLFKDTVAITVMSNSGFMKSLKTAGINYEETAVGDRFVYECMQKNGYSLGGEQSGHIILKKYATTGDGILTALMITEEICDSKLSLSKLAKEVTLYPQKTVNVKVKDKNAVITDSEVLKEKADIEALIGENGRILLRKSGTEPVIRVMAEAESEEKCEEYVERLKAKIIERGHNVD